MIGYCGYDIFGRRTSERKRACRSSMSVAFPTSSLGAMLDLVGCALGERNQRASKQISAESCPVFREAYLLACRCLHGILLESGAVSPGWFSRNCTTTAYTNACRALPTGGALPDPGYYSLKDPTVYSLMLVGTILQGRSVSWQDIAWCLL